jgi:hypothetical protein
MDQEEGFLEEGRGIFGASELEFLGEQRECLDCLKGQWTKRKNFLKWEAHAS